MPLRRRLFALISLVLLLALLGGSIVTYWQSLKRIDLEMSSAITIGETAMQDAIAGMNDQQIARLQLDRIISAFNGDRHLKARLVAPDGTTTAASRGSMPSDPAPEWLRGVIAGRAQAVSFDLPKNAATLGRLQIETDSTNEVSEVWSDIKLKFVMMISFCALVLALVYATIGRALKPLEELSAGIARVSEDDFGAHVAETGPQELAIIYRQFNRMSEKLAEAEQQNQRLHEQLSTVQDEERAEIARDLHDEIGPFLFAVDVDAQTIAPLLERGKLPDVTERATAIRQSVGHMQQHLKSILSRLKPATLLDLGLGHAADQMVAFWRARYPSIAFETDISEVSFGPAADAVAFRVLQEGTSNAVRHGKPKRIVLSARRIDQRRLRVSVSDDGQGLGGTTRRGFGLTGMRERVAELGGTLVITHAPTKSGVLLIAEIPLAITATVTPANDDTKAGAA